MAAGAGRDGTMTVARLVRALAEANGEERVVEHELYSSHICNLFSQFAETGHRFYLQVLRDLLRHIPAYGISGTAYQYALPMLFEIHGPGLKLIHLKRKDKRACVRSLSQIVYYRPAMAINVTRDRCRTDVDEYTCRPTAYHFGEMSRETWAKLTREERVSWHYDKTHELIERAKHFLSNHITVHTEDLGRETTIRRIARLVNPAWERLCPPIHANSLESWQKGAVWNEAVRQSMLVPDGKDGHRPSVSVGGPSPEPCRPMLVEFVPVGPSGPGVDLPYVHSLLRNRLNVPVRWVRFGVDPADGGRPGETGFGLGPADLDRLWGYPVRFRPTHVLFSHFPARFLWDRLREDFPDV